MEGHDLLRRFGVAKRFFELSDGEEKFVRFLKAEEVPNPYNGGKTKCIRYHFEENGEEKLWDRVSRDLAKKMSEIPYDESIHIRREGKKNETKYFIRKAD